LLLENEYGTNIAVVLNQYKIFFVFANLI